MAGRQPFRRHRVRGAPVREPDDALAGAYEFAAATYGWTARRVRTELTDELLLLYLEEASERITDAHESEVEAIRAGTILAYDAKAYRRWRSAVDRRHDRRTGLTGAALEAAVMSLAGAHPEYVAYGEG